MIEDMMKRKERLKKNKIEEKALKKKVEYWDSSLSTQEGP